MATDYSLLEEELKKEKAKLQQQLHMMKVRRLLKKQDYLAKEVVQRKQIEALENQVVELQPTVATLYCPQHALKDNEVKLYLIYQLNMRDFFAREIATLQESIDQVILKIELKFREICDLTGEAAKVIRNKPKHTPEFIRLENMSNRMEQMNKRICTMKQENKEIMENIIKMRKFQQQFKTFETEFRRKINYFKNRAQDLLENAVASYEEKEEFMAKQRVFENRRIQDLRKTAIHKNVLNLCLQRTEKNEAFAELQAAPRTDSRLSEASEMIEKRVTGLETSMERLDNLQTSISEAAGEETPEKMEESFRVASDTIDTKLSYLDELFKDINRLQGEINKLKQEYMQQAKSLSSTDRKLCFEIKKNQDKAKDLLQAADEAASKEEEAKSELNTALDIVRTLYATCCPEDAHSLEQMPVDETNVMDYLQKMQKQLLDYLICDEYIKMKAAAEETKSVLLETDKDEDIEAEGQDVGHKVILQPEELKSEEDLQTKPENFFLEFEQLKDQMVAAEEIKSKTNEDEEDEYY